MNLVKVLPTLMFIYSMPSFAAEVSTAESTPTVSSITEKNLYGTWLCQHEVEEPNTKMSIKVNYKINYLTNGQSNGSGYLFFKINGMPELKYSVTDNSTWALKGNELNIKSKDVNFKNVSHPELEALLNLKKILPATVNESGTIMALTQTTLKVKSASYGEMYTCGKVVTRS